ncbi:unnamed protein product [Thelazia callipaeda]|uniref:Apoptosis inhibitor 5 n=1 Tax=Thelazia callipaeda TaxID=103827 RepID=A0A0N5D9E2_THECL|nr:unnamed protein product [Thelazia callipaeda]
MSDLITIDNVYDACERLDKEKVKNADDFKLFMSGAKSKNCKVKKLCAQMIVRYWQDFTDLRNLAFYSLVSLLEDRDPEIRKAVIREVPHVFKSGELIDKIADVLSQMLQQSDDMQEIAMLDGVLVRFLKAYPKDVLSAIFINVMKSEEESIRLRLLKFIRSHVQQISACSEELGLFIAQHVREVMKDITAVEFDIIFEFMLSVEFFGMEKGRKVLYNIIVDQIQVDEPFPIQDPQHLDQILYFIERAQVLMSVNFQSPELVTFLLLKGVPVLEQIDVQLRIRLLRALVELLPFSKSIERNCLLLVSDYFLKLIPPLPSEPKDAHVVDLNEPLEQELRLSELEPTSLIFASLCKADKTALNSLLKQYKDSDQWRKRMIYLGRLLQQYILSGNVELQKLRKLNFSEINKNRVLLQEDALKMAENTLSVTKMLAHKSPSFGLSILPSWKAVNRKRGHKCNVDAKPERKKVCQDFYVPPGGKYSSEFT